MKVLGSEELRVCLEKALARLDEKKDIVNKLNVFPVPDGDTGTNMNLTVRSAVKTALDEKFETCEEILNGLSKGALIGARGNSGVILSQIFRGFAEGVNGAADVNTLTLAKGFETAASKAYKAVMKPTEGTILTVAKEMAEKAHNIALKTEDLDDFFSQILIAGKKSLDDTPKKLPLLKNAGVVDSGGAGLLVFWEGFYEGLSGEVVDYFHNFSSEEVEYKYSVSFLTGENNSKLEMKLTGYQPEINEGENFRSVSVGCYNLGDFFNALKDLDIFNISIQSSKDLEEHEETPKKQITLTPGVGMIAVSPGEGISDVFKQLGFAEIISGGQTMNPSTEDFLKAIDNTPYTKIIIFPNNKNIIMAAEQAGELSDREVTVIPTVSIPQCITASISLDTELSLLENKENMLEAIESVKSGQVTYSIRDVLINGMEIRENDIMAILEGDIVSSGKDLNDVSLELLTEMTDEDSSMATIIFGKEVEEEIANCLATKYNEKFPDVHVEIINGKQPVYYYILSTE